MTVLVTGANGYIGRHVVRELLRRGVAVTAVDISRPAVEDEAVWMTGDLLHDGRFVESLPISDVCLHLAWQDGFNHNAQSHMQNLVSHLDFLRTMAARGVRRLAVMGSMHEVGYWEGAISEDTPCSPLSLYGIAKNALRQALFVALKGSSAQVQWLRGFYIYGDDRANHSVFTKILEAASAGKTRFPFTSGKNKYDFVRVSDMAAMIAATIMQGEVLGIINCCSGVPRALSEVVEEFIARSCPTIKLEYGAYPDRPYDSPGVWGDPSKILSILERDSATWKNRA